MKLLLTFLLVLFLASCAPQPELCFDHTHDRIPVEVVFDWSDCPDAEPAAMTLYLFREGVAHPRRFDICNRDGGVIEVLAGRYSAVALNSDIENTAVRYSSSIESFELCLRDNFSARISGVCNPSDMVWLGLRENVDLSEGLLKVDMKEAVCRCEVDVMKVTNISRMVSVGASLSGFNEAVSALENKCGSGSVSINFDMKKNGEMSLHAELLTLGHCGIVRSRVEDSVNVPLHNISLIFNMKNGSTWQYTQDVTDQVHNHTADYCHIIIDSISIPETVTSTEGFGFRIDNWETINIAIKP